MIGNLIPGGAASGPREGGVTDLCIWNHNDFTGRGIRNVHIDYSTDGVNWDYLGLHTIPWAKSSPDYTGSVVANFGGKYAKYVLLTTATWGSSNIGLSEVRFHFIPEPATLGLVALGALVVIRRRRA